LEASELIRTLVDRIVLTPEDRQLSIQLPDALTGILAIATTKKARLNGKPPPQGAQFISSTVQVSFVVGARNKRYLQFEERYLLLVERMIPWVLPICSSPMKRTNNLSSATSFTS
jgi:hypothetical protein